jgi:AcrR family transcriptional regulator
MRALWTLGYEAASLTQLTKAMGIRRTSMYAAFGNKEALFRIAQARKKGRPHGRPVTITKHSDEVGRLFQEGVSMREIAMRVGISRSSIRQLIGDVGP